MRKSNIPVIIYLILNYFIIVGVIYVFDDYDLPLAFGIGLAVYVLSLAIALSPIGEWILRVQLGCKKLKRQEHIDYLYPLFNEVYEKARKLDPGLATDIQLYISEDESPNAFATGRKTICVTKGLLQVPPEQIKATLGHEFGHLSHKDTDLILVISVGNMIVNALILGIKFIIKMIHLFAYIIALILGDNSLLTTILMGLYHLLVMAIVGGLTWLWTKLGVLLVMKSSRGNEFEADEFSVRMGYANELCALLDNICGESPKGLFANLASSHPDKDDRIAKIQAMGASYRSNLGNLALATPSQEQVESVPNISLPQRQMPELCAKLKCLAGEYAGVEFPIDGNNTIIIGKDAKRAHVILSNRYISGTHCSIKYDRERDIFLVTDMSTNGTFLDNGSKLQKGVCSLFPTGTILVLGQGQDKFQLTVTTKD